MGRIHSPKGQVFLKKDEKLAAVVATLSPGFSKEDFVAKFKDMYPNDWNRIMQRYEQHQRQTPQGKSHPMPEPIKYLLNIARNYIEK